MTVPAASNSVISVSRPMGGEILFNTSETQIAMLRDFSKSKMTDLLAQFRAEHRAWMLAELMSPQDDVDVNAMGGTAPGLLTGLYGRLTDVATPKPGQERRWDLFYLHTGKGKNESLAFAERYRPVPGGTPRTSVLNMPVESQAEYLRLIVGQTGEQILDMAEAAFLARYAAAQLEGSLATADSVDAFLNATLARLNRRSKDAGQRSAVVDLGSAMFLAFLHREGVALLPLSCEDFRWGELRTNPPCFPTWLEPHLASLLIHARGLKATTFKPQQMLRCARAIHLMSNMSGPADFCGELCRHYRHLHPKHPASLWATNLLSKGSKAVLSAPRGTTTLENARSTRMLLKEASSLGALTTGQGEHKRKGTAADRFVPKPDDGGGVVMADSCHCARIAGRDGREEVLVNRSVQSVILRRHVDRSEMEELVHEFRHEQRGWLCKELSVPRRDLGALRVRGGESSLLYGLTGTFDPATVNGQTRTWKFRNIVLTGPGGKVARTFARKWDPAPGESANSSVLRMPQEAQAQFLRLVLGENGEHALESLSPRFSKSFGCLELESCLAEAADTDHFLEQVTRRAVARGDEAGLGGRDEIGPALFLAFLRSRNLILLPAAAYAFRWNTISTTPLPFFDPWLLEHAGKIVAAVKSESLSPFRREGLEKSVRALWLMSSVAEPQDITPELCDELREVLKPQPEAGGALSTIVEATARLVGHIAPGERLSPKARLLAVPDPGLDADGEDHSGQTPGQARSSRASINLVLKLDSPHLLRCASREDDRDILLNTSMDALVLRREVSRREMVTLIADFRQQQRPWLMSLLEAPRREVTWHKVGEEYPEMIFGLSGTLQDVPRAGGYEKDWYLYHLNTGGLARDEGHEFLKRRTPLAGGTARTSILHMSRDEQLDFLHLFTGRCGERLAEVARSEFLTRYASLELETWLHASADVSEFLAGLLPSLTRNGSGRRDLGTAMFLTYLRNREILLLPCKSLFVRWAAVSNQPTPWLSTWFKTHLDEVVKTSEFEVRTQFTPGELLKSAKALYLMSTIEKREDLSADLCQNFKELFKWRTDVGWAANTLSDITMAILGEPIVRGTSALRRPGDLRKVGRSPFEWVRNGVMHGSSTVPNYTPRAELLPWADLLDDALSLLKVKRLEGHKGTATLFLEYLSTLKAVPAGLADLRPEIHIHDRTGKNKTFRDYIEATHKERGRKKGSESRNGHLYKWGRLFQALNDYRDLKLTNPLDMRKARFEEFAKRRRTVRSAIDPDLVDIVREFNARDDFAFSKTIMKHYRDVRNPASGRMESLWYPAVAIAIDVLLELPLRSHCVRYLDTGQGDEMRFDRVLRTMVPNPEEVRERGRSEGAIQFMNARTRADAEILGIHLVVNKTSVQDYQGRDIPYLPKELEKNVGRMIEWSERYYPLAEPVRAERESYLQEQRAEDVAALIPLVYPVFRDPARRNGQPVSRELLMDYWNTLCAAVEDSVNEKREQKSCIVLTKIVNGARKALYDIHALRVTGVTNMLKRGMPPDLVQCVVGHACMVMTLYYQDRKMSEMHAKLGDYFRTRQADRERLEKVPLPQLGEHLFNLMDSEVLEDVQAGGVYQHAWGPSWKILAHGICPGGNCADGGELRNGAYAPLRPTACSVCRHRLTGPAFLVGLVANANILLHEMRREGEALKDLQDRKYEAEDAGTSTVAIEGELQQVRLRFEGCAIEWAAEVQYVYKALALDETAIPNESGKVLISVQPMACLKERGHEFHLLHAIASATKVLDWNPTKAGRAILEHAEFIDQVLDGNGVGPLLLRMNKPMRAAAAVQLGDILAEFVPDHQLAELASGRTSLQEVVPPPVATLFQETVTALANELPPRVQLHPSLRNRAKPALAAS